MILSTGKEVKRRLAEEVGATATVDPSSADIIEAITGPAGLAPDGIDVVIERAGVPPNDAADHAAGRAGGTVVILGVMPQAAKIEIEPFAILFRELRVLGSVINPLVHRRAADLVASGAINVEKLISRTVTFEDAVDIIRHPAGPGEVKVLVAPA